MARTTDLTIRQGVQIAIFLRWISIIARLIVVAATFRDDFAPLGSSARS
jgi:hypothetical protein